MNLNDPSQFEKEQVQAELAENFEAREINEKLEATLEEEANSTKDISADILLSVDKFLRGGD